MSALSRLAALVVAMLRAARKRAGACGNGGSGAPAGGERTAFARERVVAGGVCSKRDGACLPTGRARAGRAGVLLAAVAVAFGAWLAVASAPASAAMTHQFLFSFDGSGTPAGSFRPFGVAVDNSTSASAGHVYVNDLDNNVVDSFSGSGSYGCQITGHGSTSGTTVSPSECDSATTGTPTGSFGTVVSEPAVDPVTGDVWVPDASGGVVDQFSPAGAYLGQVTLPNGGTPRAVAIDSAGNLYVVDSAAAVVDEYSPSTSSWSTFATGTPSGGFGGQLFGIAVDLDPSSPSFGDVYVADSYPNKVVDVFSSAGTFLSSLTGTPNGAFGNFLTVAVDPTSGELYVAESNGSDLLDEFSATGAFEGQVVVPSSPTAVAVSATTGDVYVADSSPNQVDVFGPDEVLPDVTTGSASSSTPTSATLNATVNPGGVQLTDCHFDYVDDARYDPTASDPYAAGHTAACVPSAGSIPADSSDHAVTADITGLTAGTTYHFRLEASNQNGTSDGTDLTFSTPPPPSIDSASDASLTGATAQLNAQINPNGYDTAYHFQWGTSTAYTTTVPVPDGDIGSGTGDVAVSTSLTGLSANTEYHWRVVATSANGVTATPDHTFSYDTGGQGLPDGRGYETVTPPNKNGALIGTVLFGALPSVSADGSRVIASSIQCFADASSCPGNRGPVGSSYEFTRASSGWVTTPLGPPATEYPNSNEWMVSADAGTALFSIPTPPGGEDDFYARRPDGSFTDIGPETPPSDGAQGPKFSGGAATADLSHVVYANGYLLQEYAGTGNTQPVLVGVSGGAGSTDLISTCGTNLGAGSPAPGRMSADGRIVFFTAIPCSSGSGANAGMPVPANELYARIDGTLPDAHTVAVSRRSPTDCTTTACQGSAPGDASFVDASDDGSKAFFISGQQLTDAATDGSGNLYEYDFANPAGHELTDVSAGGSSGGSPRVQAVLGISADGSHVYFVAQGVLTAAANAQGQTARDGADNLYVYERDAAHPNGQTAFITTEPGSDANEWTNGVGFVANVTPDGRFLVFPSRGDLTADDSTSGAAQVFRYDAQTGQLERVSIGSNGFGDNGNVADTACSGTECSKDANIAPGGLFDNNGSAGPVRLDPTMSDDGTRVFFDSPVGLTPRALNNLQIGQFSGNPVYAQNVYEWEQAGVGSCPAGQSSGCVYLISDGRDVAVYGGVSDDQLLASDATGADVFFFTSDSLVPQDTDTERDIYDARVGGGFPFTPAAACTGDTCQGAASTQPPPPTAASVTFSGPGNGSTGPAATTGKVKVVKTAVTGSTFFVTVNVPGNGRVAITGAAIKTVRKAVSTAGTDKLRIMLTAKAKRTLQRRHKLKLVLRVAYTPASGRGSALTISITDKA